MTIWPAVPQSRRVTRCGVALDLRDEFTTTTAFGRIKLSLDRQHGAAWTETKIKPSRNSAGIFLYLGLGRSMDPAALPTFRVRVRIEADYYRPLYQTTDDAIEFDVPTYNDTSAPIGSPPVPSVVMMLPSANYPYGGHVRRIHGRVLDPGGKPLADAKVEADGEERVITGKNGAFTLPLRWQGAAATVNVVADHPRSGRSRQRDFKLPDALTGNHDIQVN